MNNEHQTKGSDPGRSAGGNRATASDTGEVEGGGNRLRHRKNRSTNTTKNSEQLRTEAKSRLRAKTKKRKLGIVHPLANQTEVYDFKIRRPHIWDIWESERGWPFFVACDPCNSQRDFL